MIVWKMHLDARARYNGWRAQLENGDELEIAIATYQVVHHRDQTIVSAELWRLKRVVQGVEPNGKPWHVIDRAKLGQQQLAFAFADLAQYNESLPPILGLVWKMMQRAEAYLVEAKL